jgi:glycine/D-amino acid oxidase-like deaminating enzyme
MNPDVVVIGGGIVGCSCAYYLARLGVKVRLVEQGPLGSGTSRAGMMHVVTWEEPQAHLDLARASKQLYEELDAALPGQLQFRRTGSLAVIEKPEGLADFAAGLARLQARGLHCRMLTSKDLLELEPNLSPDVAGGAFFEDDARLTRCLPPWLLPGQPRH